VTEPAPESAAPGSPSNAASSARAGAAHDVVGPLQLTIYAAPIFTLTTTLFFVQFYFLKFASDVLLVSTATVGSIFAIARAWDAVSDPLVGAWSDRTNTRFGRRRPWMLAAVPLIAAAFAMVWIPPENLEGASLIAWLVVGLIVYFTAWTLYFVPHASLGAELSTSHHGRTRIFAARQAAFTVGMFCAFGAIQYVSVSDAPRTAATHVVFVVAPLACLALVVPPLFLREREDYQGRGGERPFRALADVLANRPARVLLLVQFVDSLGIGVVGVISPFMAEYIMGRIDLIGILPAFLVVPQLLWLPVWVRLSARYGKKRVWLVSMVVAAFAFGAGFFIWENAVVYASVTLVLIGIATGCGGAVGPSLLADVIDLDEHRTGERKEGVYSAGFGFAFKCGAAAIAFLAGWTLTLSGFTPNVEQSASADLALRWLYAGIPFFAFLAGALLFWRYFDLDEADHARIRAELDARVEDAGRVS